MKLIDKEQCIGEVYSFNECLFTGENRATLSLLEQIITDIDNQPTIDAIPIAWLKEAKEWLGNLDIYDDKIEGLIWEFRNDTTD